MTETILNRIKAYKLKEISADKAHTPLIEVETAAKFASPPRGFYSSLLQASQKGYGLIGEIKKASPSKGLIRNDFDPKCLAKEYEAGGATCLSVLTDFPSFQGKKTFLSQAREATSLPALRKDFMYDTYQVAEARALGADCILIIMASVSDGQARELEEAAFSWKMDVLLEVHNAAELERCYKLVSPMIGINNRNLKTFETSLQTTKELIGLVPADRLVISESGLNTHSDLDDIALYGVRSFLVGESLMRQTDVRLSTRQMLINQKNGVT